MIPSQQDYWSIHIIHVLQEFRGMKVPDVLLSGNHAKIEEWREEQSLKRTFERRPDLLENTQLTEKQKAVYRIAKKTSQHE